MKKPLRSAAIVAAFALVFTALAAAPASAKTATTGKVGITVTTPGGATIPHVTVAVSAKDVTNPGGAAESYTGHSNISGRVVTSELAPGTYTVVAKLKEPVAATKTVEMTVAANVNSQLIIALPGVQAIVGTVTAHGEPVSARVNATNGKDLYGVGTLRGEYKLLVKPGVAYTVVARPYRGASVPWISTYAGDTVRKPDAKKVTPAKSSPTTLNIKAYDKVGMIRGQVLSPTGKLVTNARHISVCATGRSGCATASLNDEGGYAVRGLPAGTYRLNAFTSSGASAYVEDFRVRVAATTRANVTVRKYSEPITPDPGRILLTLSVPSAIVKAGQACVKLFTAAGVDIGGGCVNPGERKIAFTGLAAGDYKIALYGANISRIVTVTKDTITRVSMTRPAGTTVTGKVTTSSGSPAKGATVYTRDANGTWLPWAVTDARGRYRVPFATSGTYRFTVQPVDTTDVATMKTVRLSGQNPVVSITLPKPATLTGKVVNGAGKPVAGVEVMVSHGLHYATATTSAEGTYTLRRLGAEKVRVDTYDPYFGGYRNAQSAAVTGVSGESTTVPTIILRD